MSKYSVSPSGDRTFTCNNNIPKLIHNYNRKLIKKKNFKNKKTHKFIVNVELRKNVPWMVAQSAGVVEYTDCTSAEG